MTRKVYKSAMGKAVDLGALLLQNEQVRAVGNMGVNAVGDIIDSSNRVIDQRNRQVQRQYRRQTNVDSSASVANSNLAARQKQKQEPKESTTPIDQVEEIDLDNKNFTSSIVDNPNPVDENTMIGSGGLAAAIARSREVKQELEKTRRQQLQEQGLKKI